MTNFYWLVDFSLDGEWRLVGRMWKAVSYGSPDLACVIILYNRKCHVGRGSDDEEETVMLFAELFYWSYIWS